jgi:DNA modification methylase
LAKPKLSDFEVEQKRIAKELSESEIQVAFDSVEPDGTRHKIYLGDNRDMSKIEDNSVHLVVTSPPYFNARDYSTWPDLDSYVGDMKQTFTEVFRVLQEGRKFCLNISDLPEKGSSGVRWLPLGAHLLLAALEVGFEIVDRVIWFKTPIKGFQYGSLPYPPSPLICDSMEYVYILRKPLVKKIDYSHVSKHQKEASRMSREVYGELTKQIWSIRRVRRKGNEDGHIAPFPIELAERCIKLYSFVGEVVLDPFGGSGTTAAASAVNKRHSIMYELVPEYVEIMKSKLMPESDPELLFEGLPGSSLTVETFLG